MSYQRLPEVGDIIEIYEDTPVVYFRNKTVNRDYWYSFIYFSEKLEEWGVCWEPKFGVRVDFDIQDFDLLQDVPWILRESDEIEVICAQDGKIKVRFA